MAYYRWYRFCALRKTERVKRKTESALPQKRRFVEKLLRWYRLTIGRQTASDVSNDLRSFLLQSVKNKHYKDDKARQRGYYGRYGGVLVRTVDVLSGRQNSAMG